MNRLAPDAHEWITVPNAKLKKVARVGIVAGVLAFPVAYFFGTTDSTTLRAIGTVLLILSIPTLLCCIPMYIVVGGKDGPAKGQRDL